MENSGVKHLADLFELKVMDLLKLEGFAAKSAANLIEEIQKARVVNDYQLLAALNIPNIGANVAKVILRAYRLRGAAEDECGRAQRDSGGSARNAPRHWSASWPPSRSISTNCSVQ